MKKSALVAVVGLFVLQLVGCGNQPYAPTPMTGYAQVAPQGCSVGTQWNGTACIPAAMLPATTYPNLNFAPNGVQPGMTQPSVAPNMANNCPPGQYFNGVTCSVTINSNHYDGTSPCQSGQLSTQNYGCAYRANQCQHQYAFDDHRGPSCLPASVILTECPSNNCNRNTSAPTDRRTLRQEQREERRDARADRRDARQDARAKKRECRREAKDAKRDLKRKYKEDLKNARRGSACCTIQSN